MSVPAVCGFLLVLLFLGPVGPTGAAEGGLWRPNLETARGEARKSDKPLFVYFDADWCSWCHRYERETLQAPRVRKALRHHTVPVRINWDARPDLVQRFGGRGLPFNVVLEPGGSVLRTFTGILSPDDLIALLQSPGDSRERSPSGRTLRPEALDAPAFRAFRDAFLAHLERLYDPGQSTLVGRFETGAGLKRPQARTWLWLEAEGLWPDRRSEAARVDANRLLDRLEGGFFYYVDPHRPDAHVETAKLLEPNAWLTAWLAGYPGQPRLAAHSGWFFLRDALWDPAGGFWRGRIADVSYYERPASKRLDRPAPPVERVKLAGANAEAARALLRAAERLDRPELRDYAEDALDYVIEAMWQKGRLYHDRRDGSLGSADLPGDLFRVLAVGAILQQRRPHPQRGRRLARVAGNAADWLGARMESGKKQPGTELAGWVALACGHREHFPQLPEGCQRWALEKLALRPDTRPDWVVPGLQAWRLRLEQAQGSSP
ncbi:thioredoxin family protein [Thiohalorhabdus sp.]|uniref:thioredoxin family protein n=1 Tax=Thiohalorhabdus sp. TaxID=3094134 RepID=UPI002FC3D12E